MKHVTPLFLCLALLFVAGCKPKAKDIPPLARKEAANLVSEAQFAVTLRDYARAEPLYSQATKLCPDNGEYWVNLGMMRRRLGNKSGAKDAYEKARSAYRDASELDPKRPEPLVQEIYVLALLGRQDDAHKALEKARKQLPDDRGLRIFDESRQLDHMVDDAAFKEIAL